MTLHLRSLQRTCRRAAAFLTLAAIALVACILPTARAAELPEQARSLRMVPADAAFYSVSLRLKEQFDILLQSKAYSRLMAIPLVQLAKMQVDFQWQQSSEPNIAQFREFIQSAEGQDAMAVLREMFSDEVFLYGGQDIASALRLVMQLNGIQRTARLEAQASGKEFEDVMAERTRELFEKNAANFKVPTMVLGFRIKDADRARQQLDEVHALVRNLLDDERPELSAHLQRDQIAGHEFLTLRLDGSMIPWDKLREEAEDIDPQQFDQWREMLSSKTLAVALGVVDDFVLLSVADSTNHLQTIGQGESLADAAAIQRLAKHADQRVASIGYVSQSLARSMSSPQQTVDDLAGTADEILRQAEIGDEHRQRIVDDIRALDVTRYMPQQGETAGIVFLTDRGYEGFQYGTGTRPMMDSSKPLTILDHIGGNPLLVVASRSNDTVEDYDELVSWLRRTAGHVEQIVETKADPEDWARYLKYRDRAIDLLRRLNDANREHLYPAFADNQGAIVVDTAAASKRWVRQMPESPKPLPMLEVAIVASVSDAEQLQLGLKEYFSVASAALEMAREIEPEGVPEIQLRKPEQRELEGGGMLYVYPLPDEWGLDSQIAINAGMTDSAAAMSMLPGTTEKLLRSTPLDLDTSLDLKRPAAKVVHFEFQKMIGFIRPWIDYGLDIAMGNLKTDDGEEESEDEPPAEQSPMMMQMGFIVPQVHQFLDVAAAFHSVTSVTYRDDDLWVTHSETRFEDVK
jgi:hypothetical protein